MAHHDVLGHASPDSEYQVTPEGATYEHTDAHVWLIAKFLFWLAIAALVIHVGLGLLFNLFVHQRVEKGVLRRYPLAQTDAPRVPPEPRLQQFPLNEITAFKASEEAALREYGWVDKASGVVRIPIDDAMRLLVERGLPLRRGDPKLNTPASMPSDPSSGRTSERRLQ